MKLDSIIEAAISVGKWTPRDRLQQIYDLARTVDCLPGDFCEFGVATGSSALVLAYAASATGKRLWLYDNWKGIPEPSERDTAILGPRAAELTGKCKGNPDAVLELIREHVPNCDVMLAGLDIETELDSVRIPTRIAFRHIDCDRYGAVKAALNTESHMIPGAVTVQNTYWESSGVALKCHLHEHPADLKGGIAKQVWFRKPFDGNASIAGNGIGGNKPGGNPDTFYPQLWKWLISEFGVKTMFDVGCGTGKAIEWFVENGVEAFGCEGAPENVAWADCRKRIACHDLTKGPGFRPEPSDLVWSCEFVEHVDEQYLNNVTQTFAANCKPGGILAITHAVPGQGGFHHVNCKPSEYWIERIENAGFEYLPEVTAQARTLAHAYFAKTGLVFRRAA